MPRKFAYMGQYRNIHGSLWATFLKIEFTSVRTVILGGTDINIGTEL